MKLSPLAAYTILWGLSMPLEMARGAFRPTGPWEVAVISICLLAAAMPERNSMLALAFGARLAWWLKRLPFTWDSEVMGALTDLAVLLHLIAADGAATKDEPALTAGLGASMRRSMGWFYWFAGFWKLLENKPKEPFPRAPQIQR